MVIIFVPRTKGATFFYTQSCVSNNYFRSHETPQSWHSNNQWYIDNIWANHICSHVCCAQIEANTAMGNIYHIFHKAQFGKHFDNLCNQKIYLSFQAFKPKPGKFTKLQLSPPVKNHYQNSAEENECEVFRKAFDLFPPYRSTMA